MAFYENLPAIEGLGLEEIRVKVGQYLEKLSSAGHRDADELTYYGLAYLRIQVPILATQAHRDEPSQRLLP